MKIKKAVVCALAIGLSFSIGAGAAICAEVGGMVTDSQGRPVGGVKIVVQNSGGKMLAQALTDAKGHYAIHGLSPDTYDYTLNPLTSGFKGGSAVSYLDSAGLTINWKVSDRADAAALATPGGKEAIAGDPFGLSMGEFASAVVLGAGVVAAGVVGGYGAAGGFSGSSGPSPTSSSM